MTGIADTGFLVAFARSQDMHHGWALRVAEQVTEPLLTCEAVLAETAREDIADGVEIGAAVMRHHAFGVSGSARGVAERNGFPFVGGPAQCPQPASSASS